MTRTRLGLALAAASLIVGACVPAAAAPKWTFPAAGDGSGNAQPSALPSAQPSGAAGGPVSTTTSVVPPLTPVADLQAAPDGEQHVSYAPNVSPPITRTYQAKFEVHLEVIENVCTIDPVKGIRVQTWGYRVAGDSQVVCGTPGPVLRGRVGDLVTITLTNPPGNTMPHNIDFHAVTGQGGGAAGLTVVPGETSSITVRLLYAGAFMYHCAYGDVPVHIMHGMYGMFIVDPATPLPTVAHEWAVMQSEWYLTPPDSSGLADIDKVAMTAENPTYVVFNGAVGALTGDKALQMQVGERARIYFINEGLNLDSNFHPIGSQWDVVYPEAALTPGNPIIRGSQSTLVTTGGGTIVEIQAYVPEKIALVDHALTRTFYKGALGTIVISGASNPEIFQAPSPAPTSPATTPPPTGAQVTINKGAALDPANGANAFSPNSITVKVGATVTWTNTDDMFHTVTSGTSTGTAGTPDGTFNSGFIAPGQTWSYTFTAAGTFPYFCTPHPWMVGKVIVTP
jgi:nitrite reductase (NO-forming)